MMRSPLRFFGTATVRAAAITAAFALASAVTACSSGGETGEDFASSTSQALTEVSSFGSNPGGLNMYIYAPTNLTGPAPLVVALHGCTQSAAAYVNAGWNDLADKEGFYVVYAEQTSGNNIESCFNWFQSSDTTRGSGEAASIAQMVSYAKTKYTVDSGKVYVTGLSAGAAMTAVMLATYPDVFAAGAIMAGIPYDCASSLGDSSSCQQGSVGKTAAQWGQLALAGDSSYKGPYPRVSIWQGTADTTVNDANATALMQQWTNVNGIDQTADKNSTVGKAAHAEYQDASGKTLVETYLISGMNHGVAIDPANKCGTAGAYILDEGICSTSIAWNFFQSVASGGSSDAGAPVDSGTGTKTDAGGGSNDAGPIADSGSGSADGGHDAGHDAGAPVTTPDAGFACESFTETNYAFSTDGRAYRCGIGGSYVCATGSNAQFGLWSFLSSTLKETAPGYYEVGACN